MPKKEDLELGETLGTLKLRLAQLEAEKTARDVSDDEDDDDEDDEPEEPIEDRILNFLEGLASKPIVAKAVTAIAEELKSRGGLGAILDKWLPKKPTE